MFLQSFSRYRIQKLLLAIDRLTNFYFNVVKKMDYLAPEYSVTESDDIPRTNSPVWILGRRYNAIQGIYSESERIRKFIFK